MFIDCHLFYENHFLDLGEGTSFQFVEVDTAWEAGGIEVNGIITGIFIFILKGFYCLSQCVIDDEFYI